MIEWDTILCRSEGSEWKNSQGLEQELYHPKYLHVYQLLSDLNKNILIY